MGKMVFKKFVFSQFILLLLTWQQVFGQVGPANPNASQSVRKLLAYLADLPSRDTNKVISGQFMGYAYQVAGGSGYNNEIKALHTKTGKWVAMVSTDFGFSWDSYKKYCPLLADYWDAGHLISLSHHIPNPNRPFGTLTTDPVWLKQLDTIAVRLQFLQERGVVVFWRPFHEMNGTWFWYGTQNRTNDQFKAVWQHMFHYFTNVKKLNNLIWVYSPDDGPGKVTDDYPGSPYVDIVGLDKYNNYNTSLNIKNYTQIMSLGKPFGLGEFSPKGALSSDSRFNTPFTYNALISAGVKTSFPATSFFLCWDRQWGLNFNLDADKVLNDPWVITRDELQWNNWIVPGRVEAEDYNSGGQNIGYFDSNPGNTLNTDYRGIDDVEISNSTVASNKHAIEYVANNEWWKYKIYVKKTNYYKLDLRVAGFGGKLTVKINGLDYISNENISSSGSYTNWLTDSLGILLLPAGVHELQVFVNKAGFNFDYFELKEVTIPESKKAFFYQNTNYTGYSAYLTEGNYTTAQLVSVGLLNNDVSSVKVPTGYTVELYDGDNFAGVKYTLSTSVPNLSTRTFNDKTSSVKIIKTGTVTGDETAEYGNNDVSIYPNPNQGNFKVMLPENVSSKLELYNSLGQMVYKGIHVGDADLQLTDFPKGVYSLKVKSGEFDKGLKILID